MHTEEEMSKHRIHIGILNEIKINVLFIKKRGDKSDIQRSFPK